MLSQNLTSLVSKTIKRLQSTRVRFFEFLNFNQRIQKLTTISYYYGNWLVGWCSVPLYDIFTCITKSLATWLRPCYTNDPEWWVFSMDGVSQNLCYRIKICHRWDHRSRNDESSFSRLLNTAGWQLLAPYFRFCHHVMRASQVLGKILCAL